MIVPVITRDGRCIAGGVPENAWKDTPDATLKAMQRLPDERVVELSRLRCYDAVVVRAGLAQTLLVCYGRSGWRVIHITAGGALRVVDVPVSASWRMLDRAVWDAANIPYWTEV